MSYYAIDSLMELMINHCARLKVYLLPVIVQRCNCLSVYAIECYANSVIESSFALIKFMEVLINVYLSYSFNC